MLNLKISLLLFLSIFHIANAQENKHPKNIIVMIGDGMGFEHIKASAYYQGKNLDELVWDSFPIKLAASTYNFGNSYNSTLAWSNPDYCKTGATESASAATSISTGHKTYDGYIGLSPLGFPLTNPVEIASSLNKSTGIITSVPFNHATPAGFVSHNSSRKNYTDISYDIIFNSKATLVMGCGHPYFDNDGNYIPSPDFSIIGDSALWDFIIHNKTEFTKDNKTHIVQDIDNDNTPNAWQFKDSKTDLDSIIENDIIHDRLFFIAPVSRTLTESRIGNNETPFLDTINPLIPTLQEMTIAGLEILSKNPNGFFLMVEGGAIDWASHNNRLSRLIEEQLLFEVTIESVINWISQNDLWEETLLIVLADHECGYLVKDFTLENGFVDMDVINERGLLPDVKFLSDNHSNHLVPFFAKGISSDLFNIYAKEFDPKRGNYLHISDVGNAIKHLWGNHIHIFPQQISTYKNTSFKVSVTSPYEHCYYSWFVNDNLIESSNNYSFEYSTNTSVEIKCIVSCYNHTFESNSVKVSIKE